MIIHKFFSAVFKDLVARLTGVVSILLTGFALWGVNTSTQRIAWFISALICFIVALYWVWRSEYLRAEKAEARLNELRPWITIDGYKQFFTEDAETGEDYLVETLHVVNRGGKSAVSIEIPPIQLLGKTTRILGSLPSLGPGESAEARILNLEYVLDGVKKKVLEVGGGAPWQVRIPFTVTYRDASHFLWETGHAISYSGKGIRFSLVHPNEPQEWTEITKPKQRASD